jgi:DNA polymerase-3 subunit gamma/tau
VDFQELVTRMEWICAQEGITAEPEALAVIAQAGEGSVRDSLSALDQAIACCGDNLGGAAVRDLLGMYSLASLERVTNGLEESSTSAMLDIVAELESAGKNLQHFCRELARYFRNLLVAKITGKDTRLIPASGPEQVRMRDVAARFGEEDLTRWLQLTLDIYGQLQYSLQPRLHLELGLMRLVHAGRMKPIEDALRELAAAAPRTPPAPPPPVTRPQSPPPPPARTMGVPATSRPAPPPPPPPPPPTRAEPTGPLKERLIAELKEMRAGMMSVQAVEDSRLIESPAGVEFVATRAAKMGLMSKDVDKALSKLMGRIVKTKITLSEEAVAAPATRAAEESEGADEARARALAHPDVQKFQQMFPDSQVRGVRDLKEYEP